MTAIDSTQSAAAQATAAANGQGSSTSGIGFAQDFDTFLTILTTQLQQQDPTAPMDSNQFTQQLVQFAGVEQDIRANDYLEEISTKLGGNQAFSAVGFLGNEAKIAGDTGRLDATDDGIRFSYRLPEQARETELEVLDADGRVVFDTEGKTGIGEHDLFFPALDKNGDRHPPGAYTLRVKAEAADGGGDVTPSLFVTDQVTAVDTSGTDPKLSIGGRSVDMADVLALSTPRTTPVAAP
ncbi:flagellar basal-body rod modification protein FlgD [Rhodothalassium salexigens DSM 2132]|uniref:Basal-body rod modification protein FlgD n=1 Tax=Rhodothalassium salexigens DSM 2132 TaxID=1188247 RepID=A0A4R2PGF6_RHOSA|nr:flagellar hook capping FlgD N-terminal domain-containing protein [Rhodothalassium salexigens]MBB4211636.1 flagellar basal-body rod modification protein FlgD [Rhodothalassium salexigens DSM 2132]MBK1639100.1 hypothetical protein [Rhodothalassium salexigens DSM 2132]TCP34432.1 flagellar basal-body rod modification protein FlgD [Rhodothalassium salexigens DSM 2132]